MSLDNTKIDCVHVTQRRTPFCLEMKDPVLLYGSGGERAQIVERSRLESVVVTGTPKYSVVSVYLRKQANDEDSLTAKMSHNTDCQRVDLTPSIPVSKANEYCRLVLQCLKKKESELCQYTSQE